MHGEELSRLAAEATASTDRVDALTKWRRALELLPPSSEQAKVISTRVIALSEELEKSGVKEPVPPSVASRGGLVGAALLLLWKFKTAAVVLLTKGKFMLAGLTKLPTLLGMLLSAGIYWTIWGWSFAIGVVITTYIHEMGHVFALQRLGVAAEAPMFVPGIGAYVRSKHTPTSPAQDARVSLAGPLWGFGAAMACVGVYLATGSAYWAALARFTGWINLLNLLALGPLDGAHAFRAFSRVQRWMLTGMMVALWLALHEGLLILLAIGAGVRAMGSDAAEEGDDGAFIQYVGLAITCAALSKLPVALP